MLNHVVALGRVLGLGGSNGCTVEDDLSPEKAHTLIVGFGQGHYVPKCVDCAKRPGVAVGHMIASYVRSKCQYSRQPPFSALLLLVLLLHGLAITFLSSCVTPTHLFRASILMGMIGERQSEKQFQLHARHFGTICLLLLLLIRNRFVPIRSMLLIAILSLSFKALTAQFFRSVTFFIAEPSLLSC